jgi:hypothetical protein
VQRYSREHDKVERELDYGAAEAAAFENNISGRAFQEKS